MEWWRERDEIYHSFLSYQCDNIDEYLDAITNFFITNTKLLNLILFMYLCGPIIPIGNKEEIRGDKNVNLSEYEKKNKRISFEII